MRLAVAEAGYASATEAFVTGNELAARAATTLVERLAASGGMAGNDSTAEGFAASYDEAAVSTVAALAPLVGSFATLARLTEASLTNHTHAEARSVLPDWARQVVGPPTVADRAVGVRLSPPPSALGAADTPPGGAAGLVLDVLQDVFWPNADTDRVRAAATVWRTAAAALRLLVAHCNTARSALADERSPEIPVALAATAQLRDRADALADQLDALADACDTYAAQVDEKRAELVDLLESLVKEFAIGALVAGGLSFLSGGAAAGLGGSAATARIASASRDFRGILDSLRLLTSGTATGLRPVTVEAGTLGGSLERTATARAVFMEAGEEGGSALASRTLPRFRRGWLNDHEGAGHTITRHVDRSVEQLRQRLVERQRLDYASTFRNETEAEELIAQTFRSKEAEIQRWLEHGKGTQDFTLDFGDDVGSVLVRSTGEVVPGTKVKIVLLADRTMPDGWRLITAHPDL
ncbi:RNase A-like domain-containing protein [Nocardioides mangrovi]|uniref:Bacterial CdiA-CT RNAse A domain-containing protein n=1 Tax=Nocardioides mangrovi TaxID=2874580 RepID=A0ABS7UAC1_9ACTN|nr:RNase A-like domain-containing protein [Nocardioides mangrovi]MBZ5737638.1 hypothetical protein [Nocardioides mangrovi]